MKRVSFATLKLSTSAALLGIVSLLFSCSDLSHGDPQSIIASWSAGAVAGTSSAVATSSSQTVSSSGACTNTYGTNTVTDCRDKQTYKTVVIGTQTWMAQNLNYTPASGNSWCYDNTASNCTTYGRLYDYPTALSVCPTGWHLPDTTEWNVLEAAVGGTATAGTALKANSTLWSTNTGTDAYGFSALPAGDYNGSSFYDVGYGGIWWTATANGSSNAYDRYMDYSIAVVNHFYDSQSGGFSARCLKDSP